MKKFILLVIVLFSSTALFAQDSEVSGMYESRFEMSNGAVVAYTLELNDDGSFFFKTMKELNTGDGEKKEYGQGTWSSPSENQVALTTSEEQLDEVHTLDLTNTKARIITNPKKSSSEAPSRILIIYNSDLTWLRGKKLERN